MRIGVDARLFQSARLGGMGRYLLCLLNEMLQISDNSFVLFEDERQGHYPYLPESDRVRHESLAMRGDRFYLWEQLRLPLALSDKRLDLFHSPANTLPLIQPCAHVVTLHDTLLMEHDEDESPGFLFYTRKFLPFALRKAKRIITVSQHSKNDISRYFDINEDKIDVIYHGIDAAFHVLPDSDILLKVLKKYDISGKFLFALGSETSRKNTNRVIESYAKLLAARNNDCLLVIAGLRDIAIDKFSEKTRNLHIDKQVRLLGYVPDNELICLYNSAELFLYLSVYEGFGFPVLEAQSCGCPVIALNRSSIPELIADNRTLADPGDIHAVQSRMTLLLDNRELRGEIVRKGIAKAGEFTWHEAAGKTLQVYDKALRQP